jgi:hypothetical protein
MGFWSVAGSILGSVGNAIFGKKQDDKNYDRQKQFAKNSIRWRVQDAKKAGIHPLAALGAGGSTYQPTMGAPDIGSGVAMAGQALDNASGKKLANRAVQSEIKVNESQAALLDAQRVTTLANIRNQAQSIKGPTTPFPNLPQDAVPEKIPVYDPETGRIIRWQENPDLTKGIEEAFSPITNAIEGAIRKAPEPDPYSYGAKVEGLPTKAKFGRWECTRRTNHSTWALTKDRA